jgi:hypothetical protein
MNQDKRQGAAIAKALLIKRALQAASDAGISAQAQALLALIVAESYPKGRDWVTVLGLDIIATRLNTSRKSIQRWARELELSQLVRRRQGDGSRVTRWTVGGDARVTPGMTPTTPGVDTTVPGGVTPVSPVSVISKLTGDAPPLPARGGQVVPDQKDLNPDALPLFVNLARNGSHSARTALERLKAQGNDRARQVLDELASAR